MVLAISTRALNPDLPLLPEFCINNVLRYWISMLAVVGSGQSPIHHYAVSDKVGI